jgi:NAD-dependent dihydropyrimidine dehydrogenase PreA subunit
MIELVSDERCINCDICVRVCPTNVFDAVPGGHPVIARQEDCQTCFMCELYCPVDALFVAPEADRSAPQSEGDLRARGLLGGYRAAVGWGAGQVPGAARDPRPNGLFRHPRPEPIVDLRFCARPPEETVSWIYNSKANARS